MGHPLLLKKKKEEKTRDQISQPEKKQRPEKRLDRDRKWQCYVVPSCARPVGCSEIVLLKDQQSQLVADEEAEQSAGDLERGELPGEAVLAERPAPDEPQVQDGQVARLLEELPARLLVDSGDDLEQAQLLQQADGGGDGPRGLPLGRPGRDRGLEQARPRVEPGQAVARAGDDVEQLGRRVEEVGDLRDQ